MNIYNFQVTDPNAQHDFVTTGAVDDKKNMIVYYSGRFTNVSHQYHALAKVQFINETDGRIAIDGASQRGTEPFEPLVLRGVEPNRVHDMLLYDFDKGESGRCEPEIEVGIQLIVSKLLFSNCFFYVLQLLLMHCLVLISRWTVTLEFLLKAASHS